MGDPTEDRQEKPLPSNEVTLAVVPDHRHENLMEQYKTLSLKLLGHYQFTASAATSDAGGGIRACGKGMASWLSRRSRESFISWDVFERLRKVFPLPKPRICHAI
jgi:hypothetical protein